MSDGDKIILPESEPTAPEAGHLGRHQHHDPRNRAYPIRTLVAETLPYKSKTWYRRVPIFNQGQEGSCTAQAAIGCLSTAPFRRGVPDPKTTKLAYDTYEERSELYRTAQMVDPWDETPPMEGSSTDAPFKVLRDRGAIREWRWCFGNADVYRTLGHYGPVAVGLNWYSNMDRTDGNGFVHLGGWLRGGHAFELYGIDYERQYVKAINSWGEGYGLRGRFKITFTEFEHLLMAEGGEACCPVR